MDHETVRAAMMKHIEAVQGSSMAMEYGWGELELDTLTVYVTMSPQKNPDQEFLLRIEFDDFPRRAPSFIFVDYESREVKDDAWPNKLNHDRNNPGICTTGTRECHEHYHKNDAKYQWDEKRYGVLSTLQMIQNLIDKHAE